jgi:CheY-like chemotaxis protein
MSKILIIDDDVMTRDMLRETLQQKGYETAEAKNGKEGIRMLRQDGPFALVILDIFMPEKDGLETIMDIRKNIPGLKVIAISGGGDMGLTQYLSVAGDLGANRLVPKPFKPKEIVAAVKELL